MTTMEQRFKSAILQLVDKELILPYEQKINTIVSRRAENDKFIPVRKDAKFNEVALEDLRKLLSKEYIENKNYKAYYFELTSIFKNYLSIRFDEKISEMTTNDFSHFLDESKIQNKNEILEFFKFADLIKFADISSNKDECKFYYKFCKEYIKTLKSKN